MNKAKLKSYSPQARKDFIAAVTARAHRLGLAENNGQLQIAPAEKSGDLVVIAGQSWPAKISRQRDNLIALIQKHGFDQTMENVAYTWFNRFAALRYMEIHDYLNHGYRVLSNRAGGLPEILGPAPELAQHGDLPGLKPERAIELKLAGDQDGEFYRLTLIAQCNALSNAMPFLFERIDDETELLLPDNLLLTDSVVAKLVDAIPEEDWSQVEIIGWLYQFYISEKKDQVIGKVVKSEDIPAATQLFTPNWIVQYLVQNSVGRLWLMANPTSTLKSQWPYYIEPAEQTPDVGAALAAITQARIDEDGGSLNPETISVLDPACGSGHILVEAYEVLKAIYLERGYQPRSIPRLILEKNLFGLDIDDRAAQLAGFALLMKARADDRRLLDNPPKLNVLALQESKGLDADELASNLAGFVGWADAGSPTLPPKSLGFVNSAQSTITALIDAFTYAKTFGSLIQIPAELNAQLPAMEAALQQAVQSGDLLAQAAAFDLLPLVRQARILGMQFDAVVANPPYMGGKGMNMALKDYAKRSFPDSKADLFAMFIERGFEWCKLAGFNSMVTMQSWMFSSSFENLRSKLLSNHQIASNIQIGFNSFPSMNTKIALACAFCVYKVRISKYKAKYIDLNSAPPSSDKESLFLDRKNRAEYLATQESFDKLPGKPIAYWQDLSEIFSQDLLTSAFTSGGRCKTHSDDVYVRFHWEVPFSKIGTAKKWRFYEKGGDFRRWYGNKLHVVDWSETAREFYASYGGLTQEKFWLRAGITWSDIALINGFRFKDADCEYSSVSPTLFMINRDIPDLAILGFLNSNVAGWLLGIINPGLHANPGDVLKLPLLRSASPEKVLRAIEIARNDWNAYERSTNFQKNNLCIPETNSQSLRASFEAWIFNQNQTIFELKDIEEEINHDFIDRLGLATVLNPNVPLHQVTLSSNPYYRFGLRSDNRISKPIEDGTDLDDTIYMSDIYGRLRWQSSVELISYSIGCMMGRYSLDEPGLIYAHAGNVGFDPARYNAFPADADGIVPITDDLWFEDDAANRIREFLLAVWGPETQEENLAWLAESLGQKASETPEETIRRYLAGSFFKDHLQTYKKRPIYWLFSSGKQGAFQALVYLHRYHEGTLARMRAEYVVPLTGKIQSRIEMLDKDAKAAPSNAARNKLNKDIEKLKKKHIELLAYDEKLRHYADLRIQLDLDDGVKVNYGKFGDLLAEVKAVTGGNNDA